MRLKFQRPARLPMPLSLSKSTLAIAAVLAIALNAREGPIRSKTLARRLALPLKLLALADEVVIE